MPIRLLAFATAADAVGGRESQIELADGATVTDLKRILLERHPDLEPLWPRLAVAIDGRVVDQHETIADGAEVALLPPVSGGSTRCELVDGPIDIRAVAARVVGPDCGANVVFTGTVRDHHRGRTVERLTYDAYRPMAVAALEQIAEELENGADGLSVAITHRLGAVEPGAASVVITASAPHRAAAFEATRDALERLKREVPIWKREHYADGEAAWREEEALVGPPAERSGS